MSTKELRDKAGKAQSPAVSMDTVSRSAYTISRSWVNLFRWVIY